MNAKSDSGDCHSIGFTPVTREAIRSQHSARQASAGAPSVHTASAGVRAVRKAQEVLA